MDLTSISKFLSYVLRHHPESIGLVVDENGWAEVEELISKAQREGKSIDHTILEQVLNHGSKQRFILSEDTNYIRAGYGHSIDVELQMKPKTPPKQLYHGTAKRNVDAILAEGLRAGNRNFVHLSATRDEARNVGSRHGAPVILTIAAIRMAEAGYEVYQSESESSIWLTKQVPASFVELS